MSFSGSQRDTCTISGTSARGGAPERVTSAFMVKGAVVPSVRVKEADPNPGPSMMPAPASAPRTSGSERSWFLGANGSMLGLITRSCSGGIQSGAYEARVKT